jgi:hypothetical protein
MIRRASSVCLAAISIAGCAAAVGDPTPVRSAPATGAATVSQLAAGRWSALPRAPIVPRDGAAVVWTGTELLAWGGASGYGGEELRADGAAYDPATGRWRLLASAPLSGRQGQASVWTGRELIVWGGYDRIAARHLHVADDGAAYDPASDTWRRLPSAPLSARTNSLAVWTGREMLVLGGQPAVTNGPRSYDRDGAAYDPALNRWRHIDPPVPPTGHGLDWVAAVQAGPRLLAWSDWSIDRRIGRHLFSLTGGVDLFAYDERSGHWRLLPVKPHELPAVSTASWTGRQVVVRGLPYNCGDCPGPFAPLATALFDPARNTWKRLPADPLGSNDPLSAWTGAALVSFNAGGRFGPIGEGATSAYDPRTNRWRRLPSAPFGCETDGSPVWTGRELLMYCPRAGSGAAARYDGLALAIRRR